MSSNDIRTSHLKSLYPSPNTHHRLKLKKMQSSWSDAKPEVFAPWEPHINAKLSLRQTLDMKSLSNVSI